MSKQDHEDQEDILEQEESSEEEVSYEDEFDAMYGKTESTEVEEEEEEEPAEELAEEEQDAQRTSKTPKPEQADPYSWIDSLPEEVKEQARALKHSADSNQGRAAAFQRRATDLQRELDRAREEEFRPAAPAAQNAKASKPAAPELPAKFKQLKEDFPEFAEAVEELLVTAKDEWNQELEQVRQPLDQMRAGSARKQFREAVSEQAEKIFNTKETGVTWQDIVQGEDFPAWLQLQPKSVQQAARTPDPAEAIYVLRRYEEDYQKAVKEMAAAEAPKNAKPTDAPNRADQVRNSRQNRQKKAVSLGSKPVAGESEGSGDYKEMFDAMWG